MGLFFSNFVDFYFYLYGGAPFRFLSILGRATMIFISIKARLLDFYLIYKKKRKNFGGAKKSLKKGGADVTFMFYLEKFAFFVNFGTVFFTNFADFGVLSLENLISKQLIASNSLQTAHCKKRIPSS